jgi:hypothetical protein
MDHNKEKTTPQTVNTNDIKKIVPALQKEPHDIRPGLALLDHINNTSAFRVTITSQQVAGNIPNNNPLNLSKLSLFTMHNKKSKL